MLHIFLCEDNEQQRNMLAQIIEKAVLIENFDLDFRCSSADPHEILKQMEGMTGTGLYFLDIDLQTDMNGLVLAQQIRKLDPRCFIVFITTHSEMSYMTFSYKVEAMDFILKDNPQTLQNRMHQCIIDAYTKYSSPYNLEQKNFTITTADKEYCVPLDDILFFETSEHVHKLRLHTVSRIIEFSSSLKDLETALDERFFRCHRSYIINRNHIKEIDLKKHIILMSNHETCLLSARAKKKLLKQPHSS